LLDGLRMAVGAKTHDALAAVVHRVCLLPARARLVDAAARTVRRIVERVYLVGLESSASLEVEKTAEREKHGDDDTGEDDSDQTA